MTVNDLTLSVEYAKLVPVASNQVSSKGDEMPEDTTTQAPTLAELESKVQRLSTQLNTDENAAKTATEAFASAVKKGDVDRALELADVRASTKATAIKTSAQRKTAESAITSAKYAVNAEKIAAIHDQVRSNGAVTGYFEALEQFGVTRLVLERSEETEKIIVNSSGPKAPKRASGGGGGGGRGQSLTVDGQSFDSASAALMSFRPDFTGKMGRAAIVSWLINAGHEVS